MVKPTMLQSLLGRPSQTYRFPQEKVYHSTKRDMLRIAAETSEKQAAVVNDDQPRVIKQPHGVTVFDPAQPSVSDRGVDHADDNDGSDAEDSDHDVFYTPNTSPRVSMASAIAHAAPPRTSSPRPVSRLAVPSTKTSFTHANTSTTSISSSALDAHSLFSVSSYESTLMTSPVQSESEHLATRIRTMREPPQVANGHINQEWAKDVRWLVPTTSRANTTPKRQPSAKGETSVRSQTRSKPNTSMSKTISKMTPSIMTSMTALLEEDEFLDTPALHHPHSSVLISTPRRSGRSRMTSHPNSVSTSPKRRLSARSLHRRRSRSLDHASSSHASSSFRHTSTSASTSPNTPSPLRNSKYASSSADPYDRNITSLPIFTAGDLPSHGTPGYTSLVLPRAPVPLSQASQRPKGNFNLKNTHYGADPDGKVDLTRSGVAQTTMASVEVVRGLSRTPSRTYSTPSKKLIGLFRRASTSTSPSLGPSSGSVLRGKSQEVDKNGKRPETFSEALNLPLGFTSYRKPPTYVPSESVLVQVWAVGVDGVDWRLVFGGNSGCTGGSSHFNITELRTSMETPPITPKRSVSLRSTLSRLGGNGAQRSAPSSPAVTPPSTPPSSYTPAAVVGYIPGRSFVGRVLECGWEVGDDVVKKGDWVVGLLDLRKCGALTEFIVVDRHRVHRAPYPRMQQDGLTSILSKATSNVPINQSSSSKVTLDTEPGPSKPASLRAINPLQNKSRSIQKPQGPNNAWGPVSQDLPQVVLPLSLEELALLPGCGIPAYRAIRTFAYAFSHVMTEVGTMNGKRVARDALDGTRRRRALVLRGHDGAGAMAVQLLVCRGWRVCVHVPFKCLRDEDDEDLDDTNERDKYRMRKVEERVRNWGGEEVIFDDGEEGDGERGAVVRVIDGLREDGDMFDAVLDTIGGKEVWEAAERLLKVVHVDGTAASGTGRKKHKTKSAGIGIKQFTSLVGDFPGRMIPSAGDTFKAGLRSLNFGSRTGGKKLEGKVGYAWVSHAQDVDWEGEDIRDTLREVLRIVTETNIRPWVGERGQWTERTSRPRVVPFEKAHELFVSTDKGVLTNGGSLVVKVVG